MTRTERWWELYRRYALRRGVAVFQFAVLIAIVLMAGGQINLWVQLFVAIIVVQWYVGRTIRREHTFTAVGLDPRNAVALFAVGAVGATVFVGIVVGIYAAAGWYEIASVAFRPLDLLYWAVLLLCVGVAEEIIARGFVFTMVAGRWGTWAAIVASAALFGILHLPNDDATLMSAVGIALHSGLMLAGLLLLTRSLWAPIGAHFAWNLFEGPIWGMPVSGLDVHALVRARVEGPELWTGGAFGPEAGLVMIVLGAATGVALLYAAWRMDRFKWPPVTPETKSPAPDATA